MKKGMKKTNNTTKQYVCEFRSCIWKTYTKNMYDFDTFLNIDSLFKKIDAPCMLDRALMYAFAGKVIKNSPKHIRDAVYAPTASTQYLNNAGDKATIIDATPATIETHADACS